MLIYVGESAALMALRRHCINTCFLNKTCRDAAVVLHARLQSESRRTFERDGCFSKRYMSAVWHLPHNLPGQCRDSSCLLSSAQMRRLLKRCFRQGRLGEGVSISLLKQHLSFVVVVWEDTVDEFLSRCQSRVVFCIGANLYKPLKAFCVHGATMLRPQALCASQRFKP